MAIVYTKIQRINPQNPEADKKWFITPKRLALKTVKEVAECVSKNTTLSRGEVALVIDELQDTIKNYLLDGYTVQMGDWGSFLLTLNCEGAETELDCTSDKIQSVNIRFRPGSELRQAVNQAKFAER